MDPITRVIKLDTVYIALQCLKNEFRATNFSAFRKYSNFCDKVGFSNNDYYSFSIYTIILMTIPLFR